MSESIKIYNILNKYLINDLCNIIIDYNNINLYTIYKYMCNTNYTYSNLDKIVKQLLLNYFESNDIPIEYSKGIFLKRYTFRLTDNINNIDICKNTEYLDFVRLFYNDYKILNVYDNVNIEYVIRENNCINRKVKIHITQKSYNYDYFYVINIKYGLYKFTLSQYKNFKTYIKNSGKNDVDILDVKDFEYTEFIHYSKSKYLIKIKKLLD